MRLNKELLFNLFPLQRNVEGVATVTFAEPEEADLCIASMDERYFQKRQIFVDTWDGKTKYKVIHPPAVLHILKDIFKKYETNLQGCPRRQLILTYD